MKDINKRLEVLEETMVKMQEVIDDIRREAKADPDAITVGDVINTPVGRMVITALEYNDHEKCAYAHGLHKDGRTCSIDLFCNIVTKTGEHIWIVDDILALMKEGEDE